MSALSRSASAGHGCSHSRFSVWRFGGLLGLLFGIFFAPVLIGWEAFSFIDAGLFGYPWLLPRAFCGRASAAWNVKQLRGYHLASGTPWRCIAGLCPSSALLCTMCSGRDLSGRAGEYIWGKTWTGSEWPERWRDRVRVLTAHWGGLMWEITGLAWMPGDVVVEELAKGGVDKSGSDRRGMQIRGRRGG